MSAVMKTLTQPVAGPIHLSSLALGTIQQEVSMLTRADPEPVSRSRMGFSA